MKNTTPKPFRSRSHPTIILVEPQLPENIGMVARAMANFGLQQLYLVNPREKFPHEKAFSAASKATHIIEKAKVFSTLEEATKNLRYVFATTARLRDSFKEVMGPSAAMQQIHQLELCPSQIGILFGRERAGLFNEEISLADKVITFPVEPSFSSLNIAQAVLLVAYEWFLSNQKPRAQPQPTTLFPPAPKEKLQKFFDLLEHGLEERGYFRPEERKATMILHLREVLTRAAFTETELKLLFGVVNALLFFTPEKPRGSQAPEERKRL